MVALTLCRFNNAGNLHYEDAEITTTPYIAVSHVWAEPEWVTIPGIPERVLASCQKAQFIHRKLPTLVGTSLFWMDILAMDQTNDEARVRVVKHIPAIYSNAQRTIVVREHGGFRECCSNILELFRNEASWDELEKEGASEAHPLVVILEHIRICHPGGLHESWLSRLWPLQETNLSTTLEFVVCDPIMSSPSQVNLPLTAQFAFIQMIRQQISDLNTTAEAWAEQGEFFGPLAEWEADLPRKLELKEDFMRAMLTNGTVSRPKRPMNTLRTSVFHTLHASRQSLRRTSEPRDFVLALFPQCPFYVAPNNVRAMQWGEIWADCMRQFQLFHESRELPDDQPFRVKPKVTKGLLHAFNVPLHEADQPSTDVPMPDNLAEFVSLTYFLQREEEDTFSRRFGNVGRWRLEKLTADTSMETVLALVSETINLVHDRAMSLWTDQYFAWRLGTKPKSEAALATALAALRSHQAGSSQSTSESLNDKMLLGFNIEYDLKFLDEDGAPMIINSIADIFTNLEGILLDGKPVPRLAHNQWVKLRRLAAEKDSRFLRASTLTLAALIATELNVLSVVWARDRLDPYLLTLERVASQDTGATVLLRTLALASPWLKMEPHDEIIAYSCSLDPYIYIRSPRDGMRKRVVGIAPEIAPRKSGDFEIFLDNGCPYALPRKGVGLEVWKAWYQKMKEGGFKDCGEDINIKDWIPNWLHQMSEMS